MICGGVHWTSEVRQRQVEMAELASKTVEELSVWLKENGVPHEFCEKFEGETTNFYYHGALWAPFTVVGHGYALVRYYH